MIKIKIKILFILIVSFIFILPAHSQFRLGIKGGMNVSSLTINNNTFDENNVTGFQAGISLEAMFHPMIGIEAGVLYTQRGADINDGINNTQIKNNFIDVPVNLKIKLGIPLIKVYGTAGPYASFRLSENDNITLNAIGEIEDQLSAKSFQAGVNLGFGVEVLNFIQVGANYGIGLTDNYQYSHNSGIYHIKDKTWSLTAAIYF